MEEKVEVVGNPKPQKAPKVELGKVKEKVKITVDNSIEDVVQYDKEGKELMFSADVGTFLELPPAVYSSLSSVNALGYLLSRDVNKSFESSKPTPDDKDSDLEWLQSLERIDHTNNAENQLSVEGKVKGMHYCWVNPDQVLSYGKRGYRICKDKRIRTVYNTTGEKPNEIKRNGLTELVLMETTQANFDSIIEANERKRKMLKSADEAYAKEEMSKTGARVTDLD